MSQTTRVKPVVFLIAGGAIALAFWAFMLGMWLAKTPPIVITPTPALVAAGSPTHITPIATVPARPGQLTPAEMDKMAADFELRHPPV